LRGPLRRGAGVAEIKELLLQGVESKPRQHDLTESHRPKKRSMSQIGG
jgi:hypothetical protein